MTLMVPLGVALLASQAARVPRSQGVQAQIVTYETLARSEEEANGTASRESLARPGEFAGARWIGLLADDSVWVAYPSGELAAFDGATGETLGRRRIPRPIEAGYNGQLGGVSSAGNRVLVTTSLVPNRVLHGRAQVFEGGALTPRAEFDVGGTSFLTGDGSRCVTFGGEVAGARVIEFPLGLPVTNPDTPVGASAGTLHAVASDDSGSVLTGIDARGIARLWRDGTELALEDVVTAVLASARARKIEPQWNGGEKKPLKGDDVAVLATAVDPSGRWAVLGGEPAWASLHDARTGRLLHLLEPEGWFLSGDGVAHLQFDPSGSRVLGTLTGIRTIQAWDPSTGALLWHYRESAGNPGAPLLSLDDEVVWMNGKGFLLRTGDPIAVLKQPFRQPLAVRKGTVATLRASVAVLYGKDGTRRLERVDFGERGTVVLDRNGVRGDPKAIAGVLIR